MKKKTIIILTILLVILVVAGIFAHKYRNYLSAFYYVATNSGEKLQEKKLETDQKAIDAIKEYGIEQVRPLSEEETEKLNSGELTEEDAVNIVLGMLESDSPPAEEKNVTETPKNTENNINANDEIKNNVQSRELAEKNAEIAQLVGKIYVLKAKFTGELDGVEDWVHEEYKKLTPEEKKLKSSKVRIGRLAYTKALDLEAQCDAQMNEILNRLTVLLKETGQSTALVDEIRTAYEKEKQVAISYYMDKI